MYVVAEKINCIQNLLLEQKKNKNKTREQKEYLKFAKFKKKGEKYETRTKQICTRNSVVILVLIQWAIFVRRIFV